MIFENCFVLWVVELFILLLGVSLGRSIMVLKLRREENRSKQIELALLEKRAEVLRDGRKIATNLEELIYKAQIQKEIDDIIRKNGTR